MAATTIQDAELRPGFADPVLGSQQCFRAILQAMSRPGMVQALPPYGTAPAGLNAAGAAAVLTLADVDTTLWLDAAAAQAAGYFRFHCGCDIVDDPGEADFALIADPESMPPLESFKAGSDDYPDRSATLILQVEAFDNGGLVYRGPGIRDSVAFSAKPLPDDFADQWRRNMTLYPCGVDLILATDTAVAALPRSSRMES